TPEVTEVRTIVAVRPELKRIGIRTDRPADIAYGARVESIVRESGARFRAVLALPRALARDEEHTYAAVFPLPPDREAQTHYTLVPLVRVDAWRLRIRFPTDRLP